MSNVIDIRTIKRDRVRVAMAEFAAADSRVAVATLTLCMLTGISIAHDVTVTESVRSVYIRDALRVGVYS